MTITGQLALGASQIVSTLTGEPIGHAYAEATPTGQLQRWILHRDPRNSFEIRPPEPRMAGWSASDWKVNVPDLWKKGSFYVRAKSDVYRHGDTYRGVSWTRIPRASLLPPPSFAEGVDPFQLDPIGGKLLHVVAEGCRGFAFTVGGLTNQLTGECCPSNAEYWMLPASYMPAGGSATTGIAMGTEEARSLDQFIDIANQSFQVGCVFVITGCANYTGAHSPALL